ncbi:DUF4386 domain-containing protein [Gracilibacillus lacisalsi]|uniref:DUF4386 domain-containing protein n=1 Tax=Gracilibacillus lacisalsi TaxID=393087 RepID=UPI0003755C22|nr:DUF4386 domain-containing protein [Gracilibacillus lacisalsi]
MTKDRMNGMILGILYISAAVTSIIAVILYDPVLSEQWYMAVGNGLEVQILMGVLNEIALIVSMIGTAVLFYPYLRHWNEHLALAQFSFRFMETVFVAIGTVSILALLQLSIYHDAGQLINDDTGYMLQAVHQWIFILGPNLMLGINTFMYSYILFRTRLIPRPLAGFGMITAISVFIAGMLEMFGVVEQWSTAKALIALPVGVYEISLAVWLIAKGFNRQMLEKLKAN